MSKSSQAQKTKPQKGTMRVIKTGNSIKQLKLNALNRRFDIAPISARELQLGFPEELPTNMAQELIDAGYVKKVTTEMRTQQERVDALSTQNTEQTEVPEGGDTLSTGGDAGTTGDPNDKEVTV